MRRYCPHSKHAWKIADAVLFCTLCSRSHEIHDLEKNHVSSIVKDVVRHKGKQEADKLRGAIQAIQNTPRFTEPVKRGCYCSFTVR